MKTSYDVVVIGSGFGGAITACRLAQAGRSVCVLEQGAHWPAINAPRTVAQVFDDAFWVPGRSHGFLRYDSFKNIDIITGVGVGGGSLHYFNVSRLAKEVIYRSPRWPAAISRGVLEPYDALVRDMLEVKRFVPPQGRELPRRAAAFLHAAHAAGGREPRLMDLALHTGMIGHRTPGGFVQHPCVYCGACLFGSRVQARNTLDLNYLPVAVHHGAELFPLHRAEMITPRERGYLVTFQRLYPRRPGAAWRGVVFGRRVIVAAGTLGTGELLLRCRDVHRTLPRLSPALGHHFSGNGNMIYAGTQCRELRIDPGDGPAIVAGADFSTDEHEIYLQDLGFPDQLFWYLDGALPTRRRIRRLLGAALRHVATALGLAHGASPLRFRMSEVLKDSFTSRFLPYLGTGSDAADGRLRLTRGALRIDFDPRGSQAMLRAMEDAMARMSRALDGAFVRSFLWRRPFRRLLIAHPLGGCAMADDPAHGVVDDRGEVFHYPGLHVADGSIVPGALAANPAATISALAERVAFHIVHGREMTPDDPDTPRNPRLPVPPDRYRSMLEA